MHPLFEEVFTSLNASRATDLLSVDDKEIEADLPEIVRGVQAVIDTDQYEDNDNQQMVMELCIKKVFKVASGLTSMPESFSQALVDLLAVCQEHNLNSLVKGKTPPHAKIVETILNTFALHYFDANLTRRVIPECVKLLDCKNKDLCSHATTYILYGPHVYPELLAGHGERLVTRFLEGNIQLAQTLHWFYQYNSQPIHDHLEELMVELDKSTPNEMISLIRLVGEVAKQKPELLERHVDMLCKHLKFDMGAPALLYALADIAIKFSKTFLPHRDTIQSIGSENTHAVMSRGEILVALAAINEEEAKKSMTFLMEELKKVDPYTSSSVLGRIRTIGTLYPHLLLSVMSEIESVMEKKTSTNVRVVMKYLKEDYAQYQKSSTARYQTIFERSEGGIICSPSSVDSQALSENRSDRPSLYEQERRSNPDGVYRMESAPRGLALIIDNEIFQHPMMPNPQCSHEDRVHLAELFQNTFHFEVIVAENCTAQAMIQKLQEFGNHEMLRNVDACAVAVLSHGTSTDIIYGTDGRMIDGVPQMGTYITTTDIRDILSPTNCPALSGKPKLYIVQVYRGGLEDIPQGQQYFMRDVVEEDRVSPLDELRNPNADICFFHAAVENYTTADRNKFVPLLCNVFQQHVHTTHVKDMATILHQKISQEPINQGCLIISEEKGNLRKKWFLNPPRE